MLLRHARIPDPYGDALQRKLENVVQGAKRGWQRKIGTARVIRREKGDRGRLIRRDGISAAVMFPINPEACAMRAPLPGNGIGELELPGQIVDRRRVSNKKAGLRDVDRRRAQAQGIPRSPLPQGQFA